MGSPRALGARRSAHAPLEAASAPRNRPRPRWKAGWAPPCSRGTSTRTARCRSTTSCACEDSSGEGNTNVLDGCTQRPCSAAQRYTAQRQDHASAGTSPPSPPANRGSCTIKQSKSVLAVADSRVVATHAGAHRQAPHLRCSAVHAAGCRTLGVALPVQRRQRLRELRDVSVRTASQRSVKNEGRPRARALLSGAFSRT